MMNVNNEPMATQGAMNLNFIFSQPHCQHKMIAANPMFMLFTEPSSGSNTSFNFNYLNNFDMTPFKSWSPPSEARVDKLFKGSFIGMQNSVNFLVADETGGAMIMCKDRSFLLTEKSAKNVEVLTVWQSITSNPQLMPNPP
ncbi:hypothetical protein IEO21_10010 [Rhodonia placenta]|uniref:Uncharacterized protein n=1 Tax=Rhodonia placenta TaxID=104341 RepID=A0A8H7NT96_9APHY|nr:hypothetical protein IEO21_10010 [Postia placenta]